MSGCARRWRVRNVDSTDSRICGVPPTRRIRRGRRRASARDRGAPPPLRAHRDSAGAGLRPPVSAAPGGPSDRRGARRAPPRGPESAGRGPAVSRAAASPRGRSSRPQRHRRSNGGDADPYAVRLWIAEVLGIGQHRSLGPESSARADRTGRNTMNRIGWLVLTTLVATLFAPPTLAHESRAVLAASPETLGHVHFPISCSLAAQEQFDRALAMPHTFWFPQATPAFIAITQSEPDCAMAHWGVPMSQRWNQVEIQRRAASAWVAQTEGKKDEALQLMRSAADLEDASE